MVESAKAEPKAGFVTFVSEHRTTLIQLCLMLSLLLPMIFPLRLHISISAHPKAFYNYIETQVKPGQKVLFACDVGAANLGEKLGNTIAFLYQALHRGAKIYMVGTFTTDGVLMVYDKYIIPGLNPTGLGYVYGRDYVNLGYIPGAAVGRDAFARSISSVFPTDNFGTPIGSIPMMAGMNTLADFDLIVGSDYPTDVASIWSVPWKKPQLQLGDQGQITRDLEPLYQAGVIKEYVAGSVHAAEYESLLGRPGRALAMQDSLSICQLLILGLYITNNAWLLTHKGEKKK